MKHLNLLTTSNIGGIIFGLIVAILMFLAHAPPGFAIPLGIISGVIAFLSEIHLEK